jgi:hypothetical protein
MSHVVTDTLEIRDLAALRAAVARLGLEWSEGQKAYQWFGRLMGDTPADQSIPWGQCDHAIRLRADDQDRATYGTAAYEIGVCRLDSGAYALRYDYWGPGRWIHGRLGADLRVLRQEYGAQVAERKIRALGYQVRRTERNGKVVLEGVRA